MKTIKIELPIKEAMDVLRLLRDESRCLIENGDVTPDIDVVKRAQNVLSARERIVSALEEIASAEEAPCPLPADVWDLTQPGRTLHPAVDVGLEMATTLPQDRTDGATGTLAYQHGVPSVAIWDDGDDVLRRNA